MQTIIENLTEEEKVYLMKDIFMSLPLDVQKSEASRLVRIANNKPTYIIETGDTTYQTYSVKGIRNIFEKILGKKPDRSNIYKALQSNQRTLYGITIEKIYEGDNTKWEF